jgi:hypothetical protein
MRKMSKKLKIILAIASAVVLLGVIGVVTVMAQSPTTTTTPTPSVTPNTKININARVAQILNITESQLNEAIKQARTELSTPATPTTPSTTNTPTKPAKRTPISQTELYAKVAQILNNPDITSDKIASAFQQAEKEAQDQAVGNGLNDAVKNGKITQDEANQIQQWWQNRPAALDKLGKAFGFGQGNQGFMGKMRSFGNCFRNNQLHKSNSQPKPQGTATPTPSPST